MPTSEFTGDVPVVFTSLVGDDGYVWQPSKGDKITTDEVLNHDLLSEVVNIKQATTAPDAKASDEPEEN